MTAKHRKRIALAGGYTAGHVMPMLAVAENWPSADRDDLPLILGASDSIEETLAQAAGLEFGATSISPLHGSNGVLARSATYLRAGNAARLARRMLIDRRVRLVLGFGGYASAPYLVAARSLGIPFGVFEANALPGLTNRRLARQAAFRLTAWPATTAHPGWSHATAVGMPLRRDIVDAIEPPRVRPADQPVHLLVTGGTLGSDFLNRAVPDLTARLRRLGFTVDVLHQCGAGQEGPTREHYRRAGTDARLFEFIDDMAGAWRWADLVIGSAGAGTLAEAQAFGRPGLIVPNGHVADDHQTHNARLLLDESRLLPVAETDWSPEAVASRVGELIEQTATRLDCQPQSSASTAATRIVQMLRRYLESAETAEGIR